MTEVNSNGHLQGTVNSCQGCFTHKELQALRAAKATPAGLLGVKHMASRYLPVDGPFWLFYLSDFTRLFKDWYGRYIDAVMHLYKPDASACLHDDSGYLILRYAGQRPRDVVAHWCKTELGRVSQLLDNARAAMEKAAHAKGGLDEIVGQMTTFAAYGLDNVFPDAVLAESFPGVEHGRLFYPVVSSWHTLYLHGRNALEAMYVGELSAEAAVQQYADKCFLRWGDIETRESDMEYAQRLLKQMTSTYPHYGAIYDAKEEETFRQRLHAPRIAREEYIHHALDAAPKRTRPLLHLLARFAQEASEYNEMRRILFTRTLRHIRDYCEQERIDWKTASLQAVIRGGNHEL